MCIGIPMQVIETDGRHAWCEGRGERRRINTALVGTVVPGGWLLVEHGWDQGAAVRVLFKQAGFVEVATEADLEERDRVTLGRWPG